MKKLNKYDVRFLLQSLTIAGIAILIWTYFYSGQINKNYLNISLSEEEAKQKAMQYLGSRAWDITGYKYSSKYTKGWVNWWIEENYNINYTKENLTDKDLDEINNINKLTGENRWNMRWYNPPSSEEYRVSFTKDGDLAFFQHIMPDSLSGDSLPGDIAYNIAIMFLKNMTKIEWQEKDWKLQIRRETQRDNRLDHYFQWENKLYGYYDKHEGHADKSTIRMSIQVHGSQVARYNSWLEVAQDTNKEFVSWAFIKQFLDRFQQFVTSFIVIISLLVSLFYFKISTNWKIAARYTIFLFCIYLIKGFLEIPWNIYDFSSEDSFLGSIAQQSLNILLDSLYFAVSFLLMVSACEKLYRYIFPNHLSFANIINPSSYSSKLFLNNYSAGIVFSLCILAFTGIYYSLINSSGYYIAFPHLDFNQLLTYNPLLYILSSGIHSTLYKVLPYILLILFFYLLTSSKVISISIASLLVSIQGALDTDPIFWGSIYLFIIGIASGYILFKFGIVSLIVSTLSVKILSAVFLYFYTTQLYFITTGVIVILFLISPLIYFLLYQLKHGESRDSSDLLNSSIPESEHIVSEPIIPHIEPTQPNYNKWGLVIFIIGILCLFVPNNNKFNELFYFKVSKSEALEKTKNIIEKDFKEDLTDFEVGIAQTVRFWLGNSGESLGPFSFYYSFISPPIALLNEKVGRNGIVELTNKYDISLYAWFIRFFKPDEKEGYRAAINSKTGQMHFYQNILSDSTALPSVTEEGAINIIKSNLKSQNIDISSLPIDRKNTTDLNVRLDQSFGYKKELTLDTKPIIDQMIHASVAGNKFQFYTNWLDVDEEWQREYTQADIMYIFTQYLPLILLIVSMLFGLFFLIKNSTANRKNISWNLISILLTFVIFVMITDYINSISVMKAWYWSNVSWLSYWLNSIGHNIPDIAQLAMYVIIPTSCAYLINPSVKNLFSQASLKRYSKDAFISSLATLGAVLLFRPIEYIIYSSFPHYIDLSFHFFDKHDLFAQSVPGYGLFLKVAIETWILFAFSIFFYHQFMKYSKDGKKIQKYLLLAMVSLFYLFNGTFLQSSIFMIPHFLYRFISLIIFLVLIKYFWKLNPLCHLFGILFYFKLDDITSFIAFADPTIKSHGWALIICLVILFISTVGIGAYRSRLSSDST